MSLQVDLSALQVELTVIFEQYPVGNYCDRCAEAMSRLLVSKGYQVSIVTLQNESLFGSPDVRPPFIRARNIDGEMFSLAETGVHQVCRLDVGSIQFYSDALVQLHYPFQAVDVDTYFDLFEYPDGIEVTDVRLVK